MSAGFDVLLTDFTAVLLRPVLAYFRSQVVSLYKRFVYFEALVQDSTILSFPAPTCIAHRGAILLHDDWAVYDSPSDLPCVCHTPYNIGNNNIL